MTQVQRYHEAAPERKLEFVARGYKGRHFFPHRVYYLPRPLPEQVKTARRLWSLHDPDALYCILLYASDEMVGQLPEDLFFDPKVMIHNEHMGRAGLVATGHLYIDGDTLCTDEHQSDLVQRIANRREHKSWIEKRFGTWHHMLLNSILHFAVLKDLRKIRVPTAERVVDKYLGVTVNPELFERLYNRNIQHHFKAQKQGDFWVINVPDHREKLIALTPMTEPAQMLKRSACIVHDIDTSSPIELAGLSEQLERILMAEKDLGVCATYNVLGEIFDAVRAPIQQGGHALAFRSFDGLPYRYPDRESNDETPVMAALTRLYRRADYMLRKPLSLQAGKTRTATAIRTGWLNQARRVLGRPVTRDTLRLCRDVDYYLKGYRLTPLDIDAGLTEDWLAYYHVEWVITDDAGPALGRAFPQFLVKLPITFAFDGSAASNGITVWLQHLDAALGHDGLTTLSLPLAYAAHWLEYYPAITRSLERSGVTLLSPQQVVNAFHFERAI